MIHGETANAWERLTERELREKPPLGKGLTPSHIESVKEKLHNIGRKLREEPPPPALITDKFTVIVIDDDKPKEAQVTSLPPAKVGGRYLAMLHSTGGYAPVVFNGLTLPPGMTIDNHGVIEFYPATEGPVSFVVEVKDRFEQAGTGSLTLSVLPADPVEETPQDENEDEGEVVTTPAHSLLSHVGGTADATQIAVIPAPTTQVNTTEDTGSNTGSKATTVKTDQPADPAKRNTGKKTDDDKTAEDQ